MRRHARGFTLIELMVVVAIVAIIAAIAIPSYQEQVGKSRRADALRAISQLQLALEQWRAENPSYKMCSPTPCGSGTYPAVPTSDYYTITLSDQSPTAYTIKAEPKGAQADDRCKIFEFKLTAGTMTKKATGGSNCGL